MAETLYWMHTDPVTGSVVKGGLREDFEPLGQKIDATPPFEEDPPPDPPNIYNTTVDSEWQCAAADAMGKTFYEQPTHYQKNYHQEQWRVRIVKKEGNPITLTDSPIPGGAFGPNSPSNSYSTRLMASAMTATAKDDPIDGGGGCDWDKDGTNDCAATIKIRGPDALDDFKDASTSGDEIIKLRKRDVKKIADDIQLIFKSNPGCQPFIQGILKMAETPANPIVSKNPLDVLWAVFQVGSIEYVPTKLNEIPSGYSYGSIAGPGKKANAITIPPPRSFVGWPGAKYTSSQIAGYNRSQELIAASTVLNEVIHQSGAFGFNDRAMALATAKYLGIPPPEYGNTLADVRRWSNWWHPKVDNRCSAGRAFDFEKSLKR